MEHELRRSRRTKSPLAVLMLDIDGFKKVNDHHGHLTGDRVLEAIGDALRRTLRTTDIKCRYGGDEFFVILPDTLPDAAHHVAEHLRRAIEQLEIVLPNGCMTCGISIGVAAAAPGEVDASAVVQRADEALYRDKVRSLHRREESHTEMLAVPAGTAEPD
jgi:diguanylate cyclase (GGDEF)-like protein